MRKLSLACIAAAGLLAMGAQAIPEHVCEGPAGARNPHCQPQTPVDRAVPEPGAAAAFALGLGLVGLRTRRAR
jgi:hypothetical protein